MSPRPTTAGKGRIPQLDGLRGVAILLVLCGHYFQEIPGQPGLMARLAGYSRMGWSGVDLFFVLSGFLIGGILLEVRESRNYFRTFYLRRFFRIVPPYFGWIAAYALLAATAIPLLGLWSNHDFIQWPNWQVLAQCFFLQTFTGSYHSVLAGRWFTPSWSLAIEEQFYLLAPLLVRRLSRRSLACLMGGVVVCAPLLRVTLRLLGVSFWMVYILMPCRSDALAIGILAALVWHTPRCRAWLETRWYFLYMALVPLFLGMRYLYDGYSDPGKFFTQTVGYSWIAIFYCAVLLTLVAAPRAPLAWLARRRWLIEVGCLSYAMYLMHLAVKTLFDAGLPLLAPHLAGWAAATYEFTRWQDAIAAVAAAACTYAIAKLSWIYWERPMLERGHLFKYEKPRRTEVEPAPVRVPAVAAD